VRTTVKEAMMKRDADVDTATSALRAAADDVTACVAELMHLIGPRAASTPLEWRSGAADRIDACKQFGLAGEIHDVTFQLRALQRAAQLAARRARRRAAEESARREGSGD
jgi:tRNA(Ile)-lysidine synthase TilS/MesJ